MGLLPFRSNDASALSSGGANAAVLSQPEQFLINVARQGEIGNAAATAVVIGVLAAGRHVLQALARRLQDDDFSVGRLATLVMLKALDPLPSSPAELAIHADVSRSAMTGILDCLEAHGWIMRSRQSADRRVLAIRLTPTGRRATDRMITDFLRVTSELGSVLPTAVQAGLAADCRLLAARARRTE